MIINISTVYFALLVPLQNNCGRLGIRATRQHWILMLMWNMERFSQNHFED